jgi:transposase
VNAVFYLLQAGCQWRMLPRDFPPRSTVYVTSGPGSLPGSGRTSTTWSEMAREN